MSTTAAEPDLLPERTPAPDSPPRFRTIIEPQATWAILDWREFYKFRELLLNLVLRDVRVRYKQTVLGAAWAILQPAMMMLVFTLLFGKLANLPTGGIPAPLFYLTGLLPWSFFAASLSASSGSIQGAGALITKVYFPRQIVPIAAIGAPLIDLIVSGVLLAAVCLYFNVWPSQQIVLLPLIIGIICLIVSGMGTGLAALCVVFRDFRYLIPFSIQLGMYATPTIYLDTTNNTSTTVYWLLQLNPMTSLVSGFRACVLGGDLPWAGLLYAFVFGVVVFVIGNVYFHRTEDQFADVI